MTQMTSSAVPLPQGQPAAAAGVPPNAVSATAVPPNAVSATAVQAARQQAARPPQPQQPAARPAGVVPRLQFGHDASTLDVLAALGSGMSGQARSSVAVERMNSVHDMVLQAYKSMLSAWNVRV